MAGYLQPLAFLQNMGTGEWMVILCIALIIYGRRLPEVARSLGKSINEFKKGMREFEDNANEVANDVKTATNEAMSDTDSQTSQSTYDGSSGSYESQATGEPAPQADVSQGVGEPTSDVANAVSPAEPGSSAPTDSCVTDSPHTNPKQPGSPSTYEPTS